MGCLPADKSLALASLSHSLLDSQTLEKVLRGLQKCDDKARRHGYRSNIPTVIAEAISFIDAKFPEIPPSFLQEKDWNNVYCCRWKFSQNILRTESHALTWTVRHIFRNTGNFGLRHLLLADNLPLVCALSKGRANSLHLRVVTQVVCAHELATGSSIVCRWIASELNPSDRLSRPFDRIGDGATSLVDFPAVPPGLWRKGVHGPRAPVSKCSEPAADAASVGARAAPKRARRRRPPQGAASSLPGTSLHAAIGDAEHGEPVLPGDRGRFTGSSLGLQQSSPSSAEVLRRSPYQPRDLQRQSQHPPRALRRAVLRRVPFGGRQEAHRSSEHTFPSRYSLRGGTVSLARLERAVRGWSRHCPGRTRPPLPLACACLLAHELVLCGWPWTGFCLMLGFALYLRPGELLSLSRKHLCPPGATGRTVLLERCLSTVGGLQTDQVRNLRRGSTGRRRHVGVDESLPEPALQITEGRPAIVALHQHTDARAASHRGSELRAVGDVHRVVISASRRPQPRCGDQD